jgi:hypothetical protein
VDKRKLKVCAILFVVFLLLPLLIAIYNYYVYYAHYPIADLIESYLSIFLFFVLFIYPPVLLAVSYWLFKKARVPLIIISAMYVITCLVGILILFQSTTCCISCVTNPLDDIASNIKSAQSRLTASTGTLCLKSGEGFTDASLKTRVSGLRSAEFECMSGAPICTGSDARLIVQKNALNATSSVQFVIIVSCKKTSDNTGDYDCTLSVKNK